MSTAREQLAGLGTTTAGLAAGGATTAGLSATEEFQKSILTYTPASWASGGDYGQSLKGVGGAGTQTAGLGFGGQPPTKAETYEYDGTAWTETNDLSQKRFYSQGAGTGTLALAMGGNTGPGGNPAILTATEEWTFTHALKTVTTS